METNECFYDKLLKQRILPSSDIPPHEFLFTWHDIPCFARGELVAVTGKAKSGKTYLNSILMAAGGAPKSSISNLQLVLNVISGLPEYRKNHYRFSGSTPSNPKTPLTRSSVTASVP